MVIDTHAHIIHQKFVEEIRAGKYSPALSIEAGEKWEVLLTRTRVLGKERVHHNPLPRQIYDIEIRLKDMDASGVDRQILSVVPTCTYYGLDAGVVPRDRCFLQ